MVACVTGGAVILSFRLSCILSSCCIYIYIYKRNIQLLTTIPYWLRITDPWHGHNRWIPYCAVKEVMSGHQLNNGGEVLLVCPRYCSALGKSYIM
ncbi:hypothetical protein V1520DRAFT_41232 [Lipomyces starkeyi]